MDTDPDWHPLTAASQRQDQCPSSTLALSETRRQVAMDETLGVNQLLKQGTIQAQGVAPKHQQDLDLALADGAARVAAVRAVLRAVEQDHGRKRLSLAEARALQARADIAVISSFDRRFGYHGYIDFEKLQKAQEIADPAARQADLLALHQDQAKEALTALETAVQS